jgi:hypothetical protein
VQPRCSGNQEALISIVRKADPKAAGGIACTLRELHLPSPFGYFTFDYSKDP